MTPTFRFAPSPNGRLHLGHAYSALLNEALARRCGGRLLLRIEDIDVTRCRPEYTDGILRDLAALEIAFEADVRRQSEHFDAYRTLAARLQAEGLLYPCFCSRKDIAAAVSEREHRIGLPHPRDPDGAPLYPGTCRALSAAEAERRMAAGEPHAWRLRMDLALPRADGLSYRCFSADDFSVSAVPADPARWGDAVIVRKEIPASYHLAVVHDDALQGVTHVVRGRDLEAATDLHVLLQRLVGFATPLYHHHALIRDGLGQKLSKSLGSEAIADVLARGTNAAAIREALGFPLNPRREARASPPSSRGP